MFSYDIRVIIGVMVFSVVILRISKISFSQIKIIIYYVAFFLIVNALLTYLFEPEYAVGIYNTRHELIRFNSRYTITSEQIFYQVTKMLKYASVIPLGIIFLFTTNPSELASSINGVGVPYKAAYALSLTLRYFPDVQREYVTISKAQQARGLNISKDKSIFYRLKYGILTVLPLIFSTLDRIENISNAMDLRGFSKKKRRTWYNRRKLKLQDVIAIIISLIIFMVSIFITFYINKSRFFNPF